MQHKIIKMGFGALALCCIAFFIMGMTPTAAKSCNLKNKGLCTRIGTWHGVSDLGFTWMAIKTPGQNAVNGQVNVEWIYFDPTLFGNFDDAARITNGIGVWKKVGRHLYQFTWMAYGLDQDGEVLYTMRASGEAESVDCDTADITYVLKVWPEGDDISPDPDPVCIPGTATETRMPLVQESCE